MTDERTNHLLGIDSTVLTPIVRQATQRARAELMDWQSQALQGGISDHGFTSPSSRICPDKR